LSIIGGDMAALDAVLVIVAIIIVLLPLVDRITNEYITRTERRNKLNKAWEIYQVSSYLLTLAINKKRVKVNERLDSIEEIKKKVATNKFIDWILPQAHSNLSKFQFKQLLNKINSYGYISPWDILSRIELEYLEETKLLSQEMESKLKEDLKEKYGKWY